MDDDSPDFKLKAKARVRDDTAGFAKAFRTLRTLLRQSKGKGGGGGGGRATRGAPIRTTQGCMQRCSVRVTYARNKGDGQWAAHGRYLARDSATRGNDPIATDQSPTAEIDPAHDRIGAFGFGSKGDVVPIAGTLHGWQTAGDAHVFKVILSPEFGERLDLKRHTRELVAQMEKDLHTGLEWVAVEHFNTDHPHVHLLLRGVDDQGATLRIGPGYIKAGMRNRAQEAATNQLGWRTVEDRREAAQRQVMQHRFTDIDRSLQRQGKGSEGSYLLDFSGKIPLAATAREARLRQIQRLQQLAVMGLARKTGPLSWSVNKSFETALRQMQAGLDRQKTLQSHWEMVSDPRLPLVATDHRRVARLAGRIIGTGLDESKGCAFLLLEGTDAKVHYLYQDNAIEQQRAAGLMRIGCFVEIRQQAVTPTGVNGRKQVVITDFGPAESVLTNAAHLRSEAIRQSVGQEGLPQPGNFAGWLGRYHFAVARCAHELAERGHLKRGETAFQYSAPRGKSRVER